MAGKQDNTPKGEVAVIDEVDDQVIEPDADVIDGTVYEAKIAEQDAVIVSLNAQVAELKARNYDLLVSGQQPTGTNTTNDEDDSDDESDISVDDLFDEDDN